MNENAPSENDQQPTRSSNKALYLLAVIVLLLLCAPFLLVPEAGSFPAARRAQSMNNLKNLELAQKNFCAQHDGIFATPTLTNEQGEPVHGWMTQMLPYLDNAALYERIDLTKPWDHPDNQQISQMRLSYTLNPAFSEQERNSAGYPLVHYVLNQRLFPDNVALSEDFVSRADGLSNTILSGEIEDGFLPWAAPEKGRDPALGLKPGTNTFGVSVWGHVTIMGFADGRSQAISNDIDPKVLKALATPDGGEETPEDW